MNELGKVGVDVIRITGFTKCKKFEEPVIKHLIKKDNNVLNLMEKGNIEIKNNVVCISGDFYRFKWGNHAGHAFAYMEIHAAEKNGDNLHNMSMEDVKKRLKEAVVDLYQKYNINFTEFRLGNLRITYAELNRTFKTGRPFYEYADLLKLMGSMMRKKYHMKSSAVYTSDSEDGKKSEDECLYLVRGKKNFELKVYDKSKELKQKKALSKDDNNRYLRIELTLKKECEIKSNGERAYLTDITDEDIYNLYYRKVNKMVEETDAFFKEHLFAGEPSIDKMLMDNLLKYGIHNEYSYDAFLKDILIAEAETGKQYIRGLEDIKDIITGIKYIAEKEKCYQMLEAVCRSSHRYQSIYERDQIYHELKNMILAG